MKIGLILSFLFLLTPFHSSHAVSGNELMAEHLALREIGDSNLVYQYGSGLIDKTQRYISSTEGKKFLETAEGKKLLHSQKWLRNTMFIKQELGGCMDGKEKRNLGERISQAALSYDVMDECNDMDLARFPNGAGPLSELAKDMKKIQEEAFFYDVWQTTMRNTLITKASHKLKYGLTKNTLEDRNKLISELIKEACYQGKMQTCNDVTRKELTQDLTRYIEGVASNISPQTPKDVAQTINNKLKIFNEKLNKIEIKTTAGIKIPVLWNGDSANMDELAQNSALKDYQLSYQDFASRNEGLLTLSDTLEEKLGKMRGVDEDLMDKDKKGIGQRSKFSFKQYPLITEEDTKEAIREVHEDVSKHINELKKQLLVPDLYDDLGELRHFVQYSPVAVAESLMAHPENAKLVCKALEHIKRKEDIKDETLKVAKWGGMVVGAGLMITGVGAGAGAALFAGSAGAATAVTVATTSLAIGTGVGVATAAVSGAEALDLYIHQDNIKRNCLTNNSDIECFSEYVQALDEFKKARFETGLNLGFAALDLGMFKAVLGIGKIGANSAKDIKFATEAIKKTTQFYSSIKSTKSAAKIAEAFKPLINGAKKMDEFLLRLSQSSEKLRLQFLEKIKDGKFTPEKIRKMAEESLEASKKCIL